MRSAAVAALGAFKDRQAIGPLVKVVSEQRDLRYLALEALRAICGEECLGPVLAMLRLEKRLVAETTASIMNLMEEEGLAGHPEQKPSQASEA